MCEFCTKHGEGKKWYLEMKNYADELLHAELSPAEKESARAQTRAEYLGRFANSFVGPAITGVPIPFYEVMTSIAPTAHLHATESSQAELLEGNKSTHFGQVLPIEDVDRVIDMVDSITRLPCGCRFLSIGKADKRYCFGLGKHIGGMLKNLPGASSSLEVLTKEEAKRIIHAYDEEGLIHTIWTGVSPYLFGLCNCDRDCLAYRGFVMDKGVPSFFRAEYVCRVDTDACTGCKDCVKQCQFGAQFYSSALGRVYIDATRCFGCGVCRPACPTDAINLIPRQQDPQAANLWLS